MPLPLMWCPALTQVDYVSVSMAGFLIAIHRSPDDPEDPPEVSYHGVGHWRVGDETEDDSLLRQRWPIYWRSRLFRLCRWWRT